MVSNCKKIAWEIGLKVNKQTVKDVIAKGFSVLGAVASAGITFVSFRPLGNNLANVYVDIINGKYDVEMVLRDDFIKPDEANYVDTEFEVVDEIIEEDDDFIFNLDLNEMKD